MQAREARRNVAVAGSVVALAVGITTAAASCSSFDEEPVSPDAAPVEANTESSTSSDAGDSDVTQDASADADDLPPSCPRPLPPPCLLGGTCAKKAIYTPPDAGSDGGGVFPFTIATDRRFVYWVEQEDRNGEGNARVLRVPKSEGVADVIATGQIRATALVLDGDYVYWGADRELRRARRDCKASCVVEKSVVPTTSTAISHIVREQPGVLVLLTLPGGELFRYRADGGTVASLGAVTVGANNYLASRSSDTMAVGFTQSSIAVAAAGDAAAAKTITPPRTLGPGFALVGTDCNKYFGLGGDELRIYEIDLLGNTTPLPSANTLSNRPYGVAADKGVYYVGYAGGAGIQAFDAVTGTRTAVLVSGDVWRLATDEDGIYWGEHQNDSSAGSLWMLRRQ